ncbi:RNA polymerase sigma factor [Prolixibacteraceae bacterium JC049]|nr:RNA polymerase sigma factor [Prolixibacteraceae bacterium JC049]
MQTVKNKEEQFKSIVDQNKYRIERICSYYAPTKEEQKDMYQEILINVWKSLDNFRGDAAVSTWIYRIAVNTSLSYTGKAYKNMKLNVSVETENLSSVVDEEQLSEKLKEEENLNRLQAELNQLSIIDKMLISLLLEGLSMREIADVVGLTEPNTRVKLHRVKETLRNKLKSEENVR